ncbi:MAG: hypothetical protein AABY32_06695 [Nanoarchaeota archaeon]
MIKGVGWAKGLLVLSLIFLIAVFGLGGIGAVPVINVIDGTEIGPVKTDIINISVSESNSNLSLISSQYAFSSDNICDSLDIYSNPFTNLIEFSIAGNHVDWLCIKVENNASDINYSLVGKLNTDNTIPTLTSIQINGGYGSTNKISPKNLDGKYDNVRIIMNASETVNWGRTRIYNSTAQEVKYFNGPSGVNSNIEVWDGNYTPSGTGYVPDGTYDIYTNLTDGAGNSNNILIGSVVVDNTKPNATINAGTFTTWSGNLFRYITLIYNEVMDTSYTPFINFINNTGAITFVGVWTTNQQWTGNFSVTDADEETNNVSVSSSLARDIVGNTEGTSVSNSFNIDTKAPAISNLDNSTTDIEINNDNDVTISAMIVEGTSNPISVWLEGNWTGNPVNYTPTKTGNNYAYPVNKTQLTNQEYVGWKYYARDNLGNIINSSAYSFKVENRAPLFNSTIGNLSWIEDGGLKTINLSSYFYDLDKDSLNYTATIVSIPGPTSDPNPLGGITVNINNATGIATISSTSNWNGQGTIIFKALDFVGANAPSNTVQITVLADDNEAPTLTSNVSPVNFSEDTTLNLQLSCNPNDPAQVCLNYRYDPLYIDYNSNLIVSVNPSTGQVSLGTKLDWYGITYVEFLADDNGIPLQKGSLVLKVNVTPVNDNPILDAPDINMIENNPDSTSIPLLSYTTDVDNLVPSEMSWKLVSQSNTTLINCSLSTSVISCGAPAFNKYGISDLIVSVIDGSGGFDSQKITINVKQDHAPVITLYSPTYNPLIKTNTSQAFKIIASDTDNLTALNYVWRVNGDVKQNSTDNNFVHTPTSEGNFIINVEVTDDAPNTVTRQWTLTASDYPIATEFSGDDTTNLSGMSDFSNVNLILENQYGKIQFLSPVNLNNAWDLNNNVEIANGIVAINSQIYSSLNKPAKITLYGLTYNSIPKIYYTNSFTTTSSAITQECSSAQCTMINYTSFSTTNGEVTFNVSGFSSFLIKGSGMIYDLNKLDINDCKNGIQGNLTLDIGSPDEDESFGPGEEIKIKVEVNNENDADKKVLVKGILFNIDEDNEEEKEESDSQKIDADDSADFEFSIIVPNDFNEEDSYFLFLKAYQKGNEELQCNYEIIDLSLEREEHKIVIEDVIINPQISYPNGKASMDIKVKNVGSSEEKGAYIKITNSQLKISGMSESFDLEEYGEDDEAIITKDFLIPYGTVDGEYPFKVEVFFKGGSNYTTEIISVMNNSYIPPQSESPIYLSANIKSSANPIIASPTYPAILTAPSTGNVAYAKSSKEKTAEGVVEVSLSSEEEQVYAEPKAAISAKNNYLYIAIGLLAGIIIFVFLITILLKKR